MRIRRPLLSLLALSAFAAPAIASGCAAGFDPPTLVNTLRVFAVVADKPYAQPNEAVTFTITYHDGFPPPEEGARPVQVVWLGGCFNPVGDQYFGCYEPMAELFESLGAGGLPAAECGDGACDLGELPFTCPDDCPAEGCGNNLCDPGDCEACPDDCFPIGFGDTFSMCIPPDILTSRPPPEVGPRYGLAYIFFAACAGQVGLVSDPGGRAGSFPIGCFDEEGRRLGAESFVPGYTQIYVFEPREDGTPRTNANPEILGITLDGQDIPEDLAEVPSVPVCPVTEEERRAPSCGAEDPFAACSVYELEAVVDPATVAEPDDALGAEGESLSEVVWVSYFSDRGDIQSGIKLVNDAVAGYNEEHEARWIPPSQPGLATVWAVVRDARGGSSVMSRMIRVE